MTVVYEGIFEELNKWEHFGMDKSMIFLRESWSCLSLPNGQISSNVGVVMHVTSKIFVNLRYVADEGQYQMRVKRENWTKLKC